MHAVKATMRIIAKKTLKDYWEKEPAAQAALEAVRSVPSLKPTFVPSPNWMPDEVDGVVRAIADLRKTAVATS